MRPLADLLHDIGWTPRSLSEHLGLNERTMRRWANGTNPIPDNVYAWLVVLAETHRLLPFPEGWTNNRAG